MRIKIMIALSVLVLAVLNYGIYEKEQTKAHGETMLLKLTPVYDPHPWDYINLRYTIGRDVPDKRLDSLQKRGYLVVKPDENNVAQFIRFHKEEDLAAGEKLLRFHKEYPTANIMPDYFFFQEGHAKHYEDAQYGVFKFDDSGKYLLIGLADEHRKIISPL